MRELARAMFYKYKYMRSKKETYHLRSTYSYSLQRLEHVTILNNNNKAMRAGVTHTYTAHTNMYASCRQIKATCFIAFFSFSPTPQEKLAGTLRIQLRINVQNGIID